ncbi:hypothetical protein BPT24_095 [Tenacibaculum phage pT24]|uniref:NTP pyrophosphohydrolase MazG-like domain-containing protein n=1 Tax=Tenacibaculum phage pT24 TaxID=1880590 RepID=A0A1B4XWM6_9CAUD|nr:MazG-like pyrophosphatase [Tenacibaculum phage pT24]BAV39220.1 hypothetical protein BPT24_095 [Tenacibaculum phage pT24]
MSKTNFPKNDVNIENYTSLCMRTFNDLGTPLNNSTHMGLGVSGEVGELLKALFNNDMDNAYEECGDILWFIGVESELRKEELNINFGEIFTQAYMYICSLERDYKNASLITMIKRVFGYPTYANPLENLIYEGFSFGDYIKKSFAYGAEYKSTEIVESAIKTVAGIIYELGWHKLEYVEVVAKFEELLQTNIDKLRARFSDKFSMKEALERDLEKESETYSGKHS